VSVADKTKLQSDFARRVSDALIKSGRIKTKAIELVLINIFLFMDLKKLVKINRLLELLLNLVSILRSV